MTPSGFCGTIRGMKLAVLIAACGVSISLAPDARADVQGASRGQRPAPPAASSPDKTADAYEQFLLGHRYEENEDETAAIADYKRAMVLEPNDAEIPAPIGRLDLKHT